jgi:hypothetical protein
MKKNDVNRWRFPAPEHLWCQQSATSRDARGSPGVEFATSSTPVIYSRQKAFVATNWDSMVI